MTFRSRVIHAAQAMPSGDPTRLYLLRLADKAQTPEGAKRLHKQYLDDCKNKDRCKKSPKDFYDPKGGEKTEALPGTGEEHAEADAKKEKGQPKREKGEEKQKEKREESDYRQDSMGSKQDAVNKGRATGKTKADKMSDKELETLVQGMAEKYFGKKRLEDRAQDSGKKGWPGWDDLVTVAGELMKGHAPSFPMGPNSKSDQAKAEGAAENQAIITQFIKREKARRKKKADLRTHTIRAASQMPVGNPVRTALLMLLAKRTHDDYVKIDTSTWDKHFGSSSERESLEASIKHLRKMLE